MLNASPFARKKMAKEVEILDDEIQSRYDKIQGSNGLCTALIEVFNAMAELRMMAEYGDYLAYNCLALKGENTNGMIWKIQKLDWQAVTTLDHSPACSPHPSMQTAVFYAVSSLLALFHAYCFHLMFAS